MADLSFQNVIKYEEVKKITLEDLGKAMPGKISTSYLLFKGSDEKVNLIFNLDEKLNKNTLMQKVA